MSPQDPDRLRHVDAPPRPIARLPALALVIDCTPAGELIAQTMWGRVEFVRYAPTATSDGRPVVKSHKGSRDRITPEQLAAVTAEFDRAAAAGKPYRNDWAGVPTQDDPGILPAVGVLDLE